VHGAPVAVAERNRDIGVIALRIVTGLRCDDAHVHVRHHMLQTRQARHQPVRGEAEVGQYREFVGCAARADVRRRDADRVEALPHGFEKALAVRRQRHAAMSALEQRRAEVGFQLHDPLADGRLRRTEFTRCGRGSSRGAQPIRIPITSASAAGGPAAGGPVSA